jgi:hypothetical protein
MAYRAIEQAWKKGQGAAARLRTAAYLLPILGVGWVGVGAWMASGEGAIAAPALAPVSHEQRGERPQTRASNRCPEDLEMLVPLMLRDLPSYANRVNQRSRRRDRTTVSTNYVLIAGNPEYEPLSLGPGRYEPTTSSDDDPKQVFFTTLERQYSSGGVVQMQNYHWLFLTETQTGWQVALLFSRLGGYELVNQPPSPPEDSSQGMIAQAIRLWLRDCQAGEINN